MKKFKFNLQSVHNVRELRQEREQQTLAQFHSEVVKTQERIKNIEKMRFDAVKAYTHKLERGSLVDPFELEMNSNHISSLDRLRREAERELLEKKKQFVAQAQTVAAAAQQVQVTERLREKQMNRYRLESSRREQNEVDELMSAKYARLMTETK